MKTQLQSGAGPIRRAPGRPRHHERGLATVLFIILLSIMLILVMAESRSLFQLHREVKLLEQKQMKRLNPPPATKAIPPTTRETK